MSMKLTQTIAGINWLNHFKGVDRLTAEKLLEGITWISNVEFTSSLRASIEDQANKVDGPVGLFIERELRKNKYGVQRYYKQDNNPRRAFGAALQPIESKQYKNHEVGSEGVIATLATGLKREHKTKYYLHPTMNLIRDEKIQSFFILTDTIGSGNQISTYLDSLWKVATIKSLHSFKRLNFFIISYAITVDGKDKIESHKSRPKVIYSMHSPTIDSTFDKADTEEIKDFCARYSLKQQNKNYGPLGYDNCGTLIAYPHGIPNNSPLVLHKKSKKNIPPLFPSRAIGKTQYELNHSFFEIDYSKTLKRNEQIKLATSEWLKVASKEAKIFIVVLASLNKKPRSPTAISKRTSIKIEDVEQQLVLAKECEWVSKSGRLTDDGVKLLNHLKKNKEKKRKELVWKIDMLYYPISLRMP